MAALKRGQRTLLLEQYFVCNSDLRLGVVKICIWLSSMECVAKDIEGELREIWARPGLQDLLGILPRRWGPALGWWPCGRCWGPIKGRWGFPSANLTESWVKSFESWASLKEIKCHQVPQASRLKCIQVWDMMSFGNLWIIWSSEFKARIHLRPLRWANIKRCVNYWASQMSSWKHTCRITSVRRGPVARRWVPADTSHQKNQTWVEHGGSIHFRSWSSLILCFFKIIRLLLTFPPCDAFKLVFWSDDSSKMCKHSYPLVF